MPLEKFSSQADAHLLQEVKTIAKVEGRQFQALIHEALLDLIEKRKQSSPRQYVMEQFQTSITEYDNLYKKLSQ